MRWLSDFGLYRHRARAASRITLLAALWVGVAGASVASEDLSELNDKGIVEYERGDFAAAVDTFSRALALEPDNEVVRRNLAHSRFALGMSLASGENGKIHIPDAIREVQRAIKLDSRNADFHAALGQLYFREGRDEEAVGQLTEALQLDPANAETTAILGEVAYRRGDIRTAVEWWERSLELDPNEALARRRLPQARQENDTEERFARREHRHFVLHFDLDPAGIRRRADDILWILEEAYRRVGRELDIYPAGPIQVVVYEEPDFRTLTDSPHWSKGVFDGRIRLPYQGLAENEAALRQVLYHEYTHAAIHQLVGNRCPVWLNEGLAQYISQEWSPRNAEVLETAERAGLLVSLSLLEGSFLDEEDPALIRLYYYESYAAARYLMERHGRSPVAAALRRLAAGQPMSRVLSEVFHLSYDRLDLELQRRIRWGEMR